MVSVFFQEYAKFWLKVVAKGQKTQSFHHKNKEAGDIYGYDPFSFEYIFYKLHLVCVDSYSNKESTRAYYNLLEKLNTC